MFHHLWKHFEQIKFSKFECVFILKIKKLNNYNSYYSTKVFQEKKNKGKISFIVITQIILWNLQLKIIYRLVSTQKSEIKYWCAIEANRLGEPVS